MKTTDRNVSANLIRYRLSQQVIIDKRDRTGPICPKAKFNKDETKEGMNDKFLRQLTLIQYVQQRNVQLFIMM